MQVTYLGLTGGTGVKDTTRRVLCALMTNRLAKQFNYKGHGSKHGFCEMVLKDVVIGVYIKLEIIIGTVREYSIMIF
jgi:hypothetical protein